MGQPPALTDAELVQRCREGDPDAWAELVNRFSRYVYAVCVKGFRLGDEDAVNELALHEDVPADAEEVGHRAPVDDGHRRRPVDVPQGEAQALSTRAAGDRPDDLPGETHRIRMALKLARSKRRGRPARSRERGPRDAEQDGGELHLRPDDGLAGGD